MKNVFIGGGVVLLLLVALGVALFFYRRQVFTLKQASLSPGFLGCASDPEAPVALSSEQEAVVNYIAALDVESLQKALADFGAQDGEASILLAAIRSNHAYSVQIDGGWLDMTPYPGDGEVLVVWASPLDFLTGAWNQPVAVDLGEELQFHPSTGTFYNREVDVFPQNPYVYKVYVESTRTLWTVSARLFDMPTTVGNRRVAGCWVEEAVYFPRRPEIENDWNVVASSAQLNTIYQEMFFLYEASAPDHLLSWLPFDLAPFPVTKPTRAIGYW